MRDLLPLGLRNALESGQCVLFVGSGVGACARDRDGKPAPTGKQLAQDLAMQFGLETVGTPDLPTIAQVIEIRRGRKELEAYLTKRLTGLEPDEHLRWLFSLRWKAIFTTNYDSLIQRTYELNSTPQQTPVTISCTAEYVSYDPRFAVPIYHLHGTLFGTENTRVLITEDDYVTFRERRRMLFETLRREFATATLLYVGYANEDIDWKMVLSELRSEFTPAVPPPSYRIARVTDSLDEEILRAKGIETIAGTLEEFAGGALEALGDLRVDPHRLDALKASVPSNLMSAFETNPAATMRLLASWIYVNQAPFHEAPNVKAFLSGDLPNWGLAAKQIAFERDEEELLYDDLIEFATTANPSAGTVILLGSAGYGVSTVLMSLAARLAADRAGTILMHRRGTPMLEGDVLYAASLDRAPTFLLIDNAADHSGEISAVMQRLRESRTPALLVLGERLNEWRQVRSRLRGKEHLLKELSDAEIERLLEFLRREGALKALTELDHDLQVAAIKGKHGKQLLVVMRESTENKAFDAIIEDEYRSLENDAARRLYAAVSCGSSVRAYLRDDVLGAVLGVTLSVLHESTREATEGVIHWDCLDESMGVYAARTRHQVIADIVWNRCVADEEREAIILAVLSKLNLNYYADVGAFEAFIRSDRHVDSIRSLEGRIKYFESASRKAPENPYVLQHYARMLLRMDKPDLALAQVERAIGVGPGVRVLYHTKGVVLQDLALTIESMEIARKRLAQSEGAFRIALGADPKDAYSYQGLARLYLGWAKRVHGDEQSDYLSKAEEIIGEGLRSARERSGLWIVSSEIEKWLGNRPDVITALEKAVAASPGSSVARYLLGRAYRRSGELQKAAEILHGTVENDPNEFRSGVEYAQCLAELGEPYERSIAVLKLGSLYGMKDPRYLATLGGMLFVNGGFSEADQIFASARAVGFTFEELTRVEFSPSDPSDRAKPLRLEGVVVKVGPGYAFLRPPGFPDIFCHGSKFGRLLLVKDMKVSFKLAFSARGPLALDLQHPGQVVAAEASYGPVSRSM